jgi:DNA-directed RNA polymerase subunit RPC12/RpoP
MPPRLTIDDCQDYAELHKGDCLEMEYFNINHPMRWRCKYKHEWVVAFAGMRSSNQWCPYCSGRRNNNIEKIQAYAKSRNGKCLEKVYIDNKTMMEFQCFADPNKEHIWKARWDWMSKDQTWCPYCSGKYNNNLELCQEIAKNRKGKCLSKSYKNEKERMVWECELEHQWEAPFEPIKNDGTWCPTCSKGRSEKCVKNIIEMITEKKFIQIRPDWLRYENGRNLELDGYNEELKIAYEYQGIQHYQYDKFFHKGNKENLKLQQERDIWKEIQCYEKEIDLIVIPYTYNFNTFDKMYDFIESELDKIYEKRRVNEVDSDDDDL